MSRRTRRQRPEPIELTIDTLSHEGRGVGRVNGKAVFVHGALPGEQVVARILRKRGRFDEAEVTTVLAPSAERITPACAHYGLCGGCSLQHMDEDFQLRHKQGVLLELLRHQGKGIVPDVVTDALRGPQFGYRRKARLGVKSVAAKGGVLVGFRERAKPYITDCSRCDILDPRVGTLLPALREMIAGLAIADRIPQIEVAIGDAECVLVIRHLEPLADADRRLLIAFGERTGVQIWAQSGGPETVRPLADQALPLRYCVDGLVFEFQPTDFTQVNAAINEAMVARALDYLALAPSDRLLDLFCGIGNFSLPLARRSARVVGVEGESALVARAAANAARNGITNCEFVVTDLADKAAIAELDFSPHNKMLIDPPRTGALALLESASLQTIERLVYVSCNPVTFARDAAVLCERHGFHLAATGIADMFPQTAHVESISVFDKR